MQVLAGPTYNMDVPAYVAREGSGVPGDNSNRAGVPSSCLFLNGDEDGNEVVVGDRKTTYRSDELSDSSSSSIGDPGDTDDEGADDDVVSDWKEVKDEGSEPGLTRNRFSMDSFQDSLPNNGRRSGLSRHYSGKSKSFGNLGDVIVSTRSVKEIEKEENPLNKRRRVLIANKWSRKFFYSRLHSNKSMPLLPVLPDDDDEQQQQDEDEDEDEDEDRDSNDQELLPQGNYNSSRLPHQVTKMGFKSQSCFCLADLQEEPEDELD